MSEFCENWGIFDVCTPFYESHEARTKKKRGQMDGLRISRFREFSAKLTIYGLQVSLLEYLK